MVFSSCIIPADTIRLLKLFGLENNEVLSNSGEKLTRMGGFCLLSIVYLVETKQFYVAINYMKHDTITATIWKHDGQCAKHSLKVLLDNYLIQI